MRMCRIENKQMHAMPVVSFTQFHTAVSQLGKKTCGISTFRFIFARCSVRKLGKTKDGLVMKI